ncbi:cytochrome P450 [Sciscionella marina]|uniref:cytochrome P450 n=1 Tax=Sciscionella marina TaxID=508770 RepID=UPI000372B9D0|nr:cytochrome P450 [Sciscionella marina]
MLDYPFNASEGLAIAERYREVQAEPGLVRVRMPYGEPGWLVTRYAEARAVLGDPRFSRAEALRRDPPSTQPARANKGLLTMDAPGHTRLRRLAAKAFTPKRVEQLRPWLRDYVGELLDAMIQAGPPAELVGALALPLPVGVICELLGVPVQDRERFRRWSDDALSTSGLTTEQWLASRAELEDYLAGLIAAHRERPRDDLMSAFIEAREDEDRLTEDEMIGLCAGILIAGHETTATQIPNFVSVLLGEREQWEQLCADPELIPAAVEELMRFVPLGTSGNSARYATEDVVVGETRVRAGEPVVVAVSAANRDRGWFSDADRLDLDRAEGGHLGFGHGAHFCLGAALARAELQVALHGLTTRLPGLRLAGEITWKSGLIVRGPSALAVEW